MSIFAENDRDYTRVGLTENNRLAKILSNTLAYFSKTISSFLKFWPCSREGFAQNKKGVLNLKHFLLA
jgi:hypothetical protein